MWYLYPYYEAPNGDRFPHIYMTFPTYLDAVSFMASNWETFDREVFPVWELRSSPLPEDRAEIEELLGA